MRHAGMECAARSAVPLHSSDTCEGSRDAARFRRLDGHRVASLGSHSQSRTIGDQSKDAITDVAQYDAVRQWLALLRIGVREAAARAHSQWLGVRERR